MRKIIFILMAAVVSLASVMVSKAADIKMQKATFEDYIPLLELAGYHVFCYDIKSMSDKQYKLTFSIREYKGDSLVNKNIMDYPASTKNMTLLSEFSEEDQTTIKEENMYDPSRRIYSCAEKIAVGTYSKNDSTATLMIDVDGEATYSTLLDLKPQSNPQTGEKQYLYLPKPFKTGDIKLGEFIPLMFYGSAWYDSRYKVFRFCGENELNPDMSNRMIKDVPHSYVVGVTITEIDY